MKVLGFRADPDGARYAIVENNGGDFSLLNAPLPSQHFNTFGEGSMAISRA
jgi:hypothetical protein